MIFAIIGKIVVCFVAAFVIFTGIIAFLAGINDD